MKDWKKTKMSLYYMECWCRWDIRVRPFPGRWSFDMKSLQPDSAYDYSPYSHNVRRAPVSAPSAFHQAFQIVQVLDALRLRLHITSRTGNSICASTHDFYAASTYATDAVSGQISNLKNKIWTLLVHLEPRAFHGKKHLQVALCFSLELKTEDVKRPAMVLNGACGLVVLQG